MKYKFDSSEVQSPIGIIRKFPIMIIEEDTKYGEFFVSEIINLSSDIDYVNEIVVKLESLINGKINFYEGFGFEVYMIECDKNNAVVKNIFEDDKVDAIIPTQEVYELMRDWRDYLIDYYSKNNL